MIEVNLAIALIAGMLAAFNPCGFAMLPAYLGAFVLGQRKSAGNNLSRALKFSLGMAIGLLLVFGAFALLILPFSSAIEAYLPWVTILIGVALTIAGVSTLFGKGFGFSRITNGSFAPGKSLVSQIGYGVSFALASLSCTIGPFLAATATAISAGSALSLVMTLLSYGAGMALVILVLALLTASTGPETLTKIRSKTGLWERILGGLLLVSGLYVLAYSQYELAIQAGSVLANPIVDFGIQIQSFGARILYMIGPLWLTFIALLLASPFVYSAWKTKRREVDPKK